MIRDTLLRRLVLWVLPGALAGVVAAYLVGGRFVTPGELDPAVWDVVTPGLDERVEGPRLGRGVIVSERALRIRPHFFFRSEHLTPRDERAVGGIELTMAAGTGPLSLVLHGSGTSMLFLRFTDAAWHGLRVDEGWRTRDDAGPWGIRIVDGVAWLRQRAGAVRLGSVAPGPIELTAEDGEVRIAALSLLDTAGEVILDADYRGAGVGHVGGLVAVVLGALAGAALSLVAPRRPLAALAALVPPLVVLAVPSITWLSLVERLYLVRMPAWGLARWAGLASLVPLAAMAFLASGILRVASGPPDRRWSAVAVLAALAASREPGIGIPLGIGLLGMSAYLARAARRDEVEWLVLSLPALAAVAIVGWHAGLWIAVGWMALLVAGNVRTFLAEAPRPAANLLGVLAFVAPVSLELAMRTTWLDTAWDSARIAGEGTNSAKWDDPDPFWQGRCGPSLPTREVNILVTGGSSTGGAYQLRGEPEAFFPARLHARLCAELPPDVGIRMSNFGDGGRDSFTVSRSLETWMDRAGSDLVVFYGGVNDLLTRNNRLTRKQAEAKEAAMGSATRGVASLVARSRLLTGLALLARAQDTSATVQDVPIDDAEENLRRIAAAVGARGGRVLLTTEHTQGDTKALLAYAALEAKIADEVDHVDYVDVSAGLAPYAGEALLVDQNHLTRGGAGRLAEVLEPTVRAAVGL